MSQLKKCKHCQSEIDKKAKICPVCKKKQGGIGKFIIIGIVAVGILGAALNGGDNGPKKVEPTSSSADDSAVQANGTSNNEAEVVATATPVPTSAPEKTTFAIGETVELNNIMVTMVGVSESNGSDYNKPADGNVFAICEFEIENNSSNDIAVSSVISFEAYCDDYAIQQSFTGLMEASSKKQLDGSVAAGKKMNGVIAYELPSDWKELEINYTPVFWSGKDITFIASK